MVRRKIRPLGVLACVVVFLLFQFIRKGGREVFTFDSLPPYTDTDDYVKKPVPPPVHWTDPPPPPPEWGNRQPGREGNYDQKPIAQNPKVRPEVAASSSKNQPQSKEQPVGGGTETKNPVIHKEDTEFPLSTLPDSKEGGHFGHRHSVPDQPPVPGDLPFPEQIRHTYTAEELAPRIEKYPIPPNEIIKLPIMKPVPLPKIQAQFPAESSQQKHIRLQRQAAIKRAMTRSWEAYSSNAMGHDEVRPITGRYYDPFCGWGATLVDSLDTLKIMGMDTEYQEALKYVAEIDFAHTGSYSVPLFETVIRYLGGLIGAYDISGGKDTILLEKAKDLADMLMGAFDTVNRMPLLRFDWRPKAARQNLRANSDSCLAELGTLTVEFTRLAQLTGNHSYFDAVQRITDGFEGFKFSHVPGLYPLRIDASGCKYEKDPLPETPKQIAVAAPVVEENTKSQFEKRAAIESLPPTQELSHLEDGRRVEMGNAMRESLANMSSMPAGQTTKAEQVQAFAKCDPQGLIPSIWRSVQEFSFGGEADSTYEYFLKEYILLGGAKEQYKKLYLDSIQAAENYLFFRPLVEGDPEIMFSGKYRTRDNDDGTLAGGEFVGEMQHLTCFVGGMLAMGSKIFDRPHDLVLAEKITDGCVWAYNITATGVMPETFSVDVCYEMPCHWAPRPTLASVLDNTLSDLPAVGQQNEEFDGNKPIPGLYGNHRQNKRAAEPEPLPPSTHANQSRPGPPLPEWPSADEMVEPVEFTSGKSLNDIDPNVQKLAAERLVAEAVKEEIHRPESLHYFMDTRYILRPEAIESVFYMWRITGDPSWQEKGWNMWESIEQATRTELAYSAIMDVNDPDSAKADSMESFWLSETLKYFYLLYSEPDLVSLDDWVFNTEAHPFKRPVLGPR